jgi:hypothetical protein
MLDLLQIPGLLVAHTITDLQLLVGNQLKANYSQNNLDLTHLCNLREPLYRVQLANFLKQTSTRKSAIG